MHTPVLLLAYNRIDTLAQVWEVLRQVRPKYLFLSADGPKPTPEDKERTAAVRTFLQKNIDWPCEAYFNFLPENLGCKKGVATEQALFSRVWSPPLWRKAWNHLRSLYLTHV